MTSKSLPHHHTRKRIQYPWEVCILATSTPTILKRCTLHTLKSCGIPASKITVFVQGKDEKQTFQEQLSQGTYNRIIASQDVGVTGLLRCIYSMYKVGTPLVLCRDSIKGLLQRKELTNSKSKPVKSLIPLFQSIFSVCANEKVGLWGLSPSLSEKPDIRQCSRGIYPISGAVWGVYNPGYIPEFSVSLETIPEIQSVFQFSRMYGGILQVNTISAQWSPEKHSDQHDAEIIRLIKLYPEYATAVRSNTGKLELRIFQTKDYKEI